MKERFLGPLQLRAMRLLWARPSQTVHELIAALNVQKGYPVLAYTTVLTICRNLTKAGAVEVIKGKRCHLFAPIISKLEYQQHAMSLTLADAFGGDVKVALKVLKSLK